MTAQVINGLFQSQSAVWGGLHTGPSIVHPTLQGFIVVPNNNRVSVTITGVLFTTSLFSSPGSQFPVTINPGQSVIIEVDYIPIAAGGSNVILDTATLQVSAGIAPVIPLFVTATGQVGIFPSYLYPFPTTKIGSSATYTNYIIVNTNILAPITVNSLTLTTGTDFFIVGAPITPFVIPTLGASPLFSIQFTPTVVGLRSDTLNVTLSDSTVISASMAGMGSVLQSVFSLSGGKSAPLFAFPNIILQSEPINSNGCEEASNATRMHDFQIMVTEKELLRVRGHYEDWGPATFSIIATTRRIGQPDAIVSAPVSVGTSVEDGWIREFIADVNITGELIQLIISRAGNSGNLFIIDYIPELVLKGEVIGGT